MLFTVFFLLPGFIIQKLLHATKEYRDLSVFEYTTFSIGYSIIIFVVWIFYNQLLCSFDYIQYPFIAQLKSFFIDQNSSLLFSEFSVVFFLSYFCCFICIAVVVYTLSWINLWKSITRGLGLVRFSDHLTPWEDFITLNKMNWLSVEMKDGRTVLGKIGLSSHLPFDREIVLKRVDQTPIAIYGSDNKKVNFGPEIEYSYISTSEIKAIHAICDNEILPKAYSFADYFHVALPLIIFVSVSLVTFSLIILNINNCFKHSFIIDLAGLVVVITSFLWNVKSLSRFA